MNRLKEYLLEAIQQTNIFEMAESRKDLKRDIDGHIYQIIENWCLVKYCTLYDPDNRTKHHWQDELETHLIHIFEKRLKFGDAESKYKVIRDWVIDTLEINTARRIEMIMRVKLRKENITMPNYIYELCINELNVILKLISDKYTDNNFDKIIDYIEKL